MATWIIGIIVLGLMAFAGYKTIKRSRKGGCYGCPGCSAADKRDRTAKQPVKF